MRGSALYPVQTLSIFSDEVAGAGAGFLAETEVVPVQNSHDIYVVKKNLEQVYLGLV